MTHGYKVTHFYSPYILKALSKKKMNIYFSCVQISSSYSNNDNQKRAELFVNWNSDKSDQNLRFKINAKDNSYDSNIDKDYTIEVRTQNNHNKNNIH